MEITAKLEVLADAAKYDASCASSGSKNAPPKGALGSTDGMGICHSFTPDGRCVSLVKVMPFVVTSDHRPVRLLDREDLAQRLRGPPTQLGLFGAA